MNDINFTFGIITNADNGANEHLKKSIASIVELNIPKYEIIIVGNKIHLENEIIISSNDNIHVIDFDESIRPLWISKKKNLITEKAKYENIVYLHDYISFDLNWYEGFKIFGDVFKACMTKIVNADGQRYRDWVIFPWFSCYGDDFIKGSKELWNYSGIQNNESLIPYDENNFNRHQYFSGAYWVAKKEIMQEIPLDESLLWGNGEDCIWSSSFSKKYEFSMNPHSSVHLLKWKQDAFGLIRPECHKKALEFISIK